MIRTRKSLPRLAATAMLILAGTALGTSGFAAQGPAESPAAAPDQPPAGKPAAAPSATSSATDAGAGKTEVERGEAKADGAAAQARPPLDPRQAQDQDREAFFDAHLAALHAGLTLTGEQQPLWTPVESAIRALEKTRHPRRTREEIAKLLDESPSDLLRMRGEQLSRRGDAMRQLAEAASPLVDKLDDAQKRRLPYLLEGMRAGPVLRAAFDLRDGRVVDEPDAGGRHGRQGGDEGASNQRDDDRAEGPREYGAMPDGDRLDRYRRRRFEGGGPMRQPPERSEMSDDDRS